MKFLKKYSFVIGIFLFLFILSRLDFSYYRDLAQRINIAKFILVCCIFLATLFLQSYRWLKLMEVQGIHYSFWQSFSMYQVSKFVGLFTPGRIGETSKVLYLAKDYSTGKSFVSIVLDRLFDVVFLLLAGFWGMFLFLRIFKGGILIFFIFVFSLFLLPFIIWKSVSARGILKRVFYFFLPQKYHNKWQTNFRDFIVGLKSYNAGHYAYAFFLTLVIWYVYYVAIYLFACDIGIKMPFFYFSSALSLASLIAFLPISIAGIGTRDAALLAMFSVFNVSKELTIAVSMLVLFLIFLSAFVGLLCWIKKPFFRD